MKVRNLFVVLLLVLSAVPASAAEEMQTVCIQRSGEKICDVPEGCIMTYDAATQNQAVKCPFYEPSIDVVFVIDSTGSMGDEIRTVQTHLTKIIKEVKSGQPTPNLRGGIVAYRDYELEEREYLYRKLDLTSDTDEAVNFIWGIEARGGGDLPEAVADGLDAAINSMKWNDASVVQNQEIKTYPYAKKLIFLIGDATPHGEGSTDRSYMQGSPNGFNYRQNIKDALDKGITIYAVSGSGIDSVGVRIFKEIAAKTGGIYTSLSYVRKNVEQYYHDEGFSSKEVKEYSAEAREDADYDRKTNSILTNSLGTFAKSTMQAEAKSIGVSYDNPDDGSEGKESWISPEDITGEVIIEPDAAPNTSLSDFFRKIFDRITFWR